MILKEQVLAVTDRRNDYEEAGAYYEGEVAEVFATAGLRRAMRKTGYRSRLNFCRPVVDAVQNRLEIAAVQGTSDTGSKVIDETWEFNELGLDSNEIHRWALVYGDCYAMVWPDEEGNIEISYNTPLTTTIVYDPEHPRRKLYALKMWESEDGTHLNVYGPDTIDKYFTQSKEVTEGAQWSLQDSIENPFGEVPVFHFRTMRPFGRPEHKDAFDAQNYINKQFIQSMITADYQGAPQRYALSKIESSSEIEDFEEGDTDRENIGALKNGPGEVWYMKGVDKVGEFKPADPEVFWKPIKDTVRSMASLTNTPLHYFEKTGNVPSGEALRVAEAPLIKKVADRKQSFGQSWRDLFKFVLKANGLEEDVQVKWVEVESLDELERLDAALKKRNEGLSLQQVMREQGYDEEVIARVIAEAKEERDLGLVQNYERAANTNPNVRVQPENDERNV
jgi:hypothetical protein